MFRFIGASALFANEILQPDKIAGSSVWGQNVVYILWYCEQKLLQYRILVQNHELVLWLKFFTWTNFRKTPDFCKRGIRVRDLHDTAFHEYRLF